MCSRINIYAIAALVTFSTLVANAHAQTAAQTNLDAAGNITFQVNGQTALKMSTQTQVCDSNSAGAIRFNQTSKLFEGCNGVAWLPFGSFDNRVWVDESSARALDVSYVNDTGQPIEVSVRTLSSSPVAGAGPGYVFRCNATLQLMA